MIAPTPVECQREFDYPAKAIHTLIKTHSPYRTDTHGTAQTGKTALLTGDLVQVVAHVPQRLLAARDRALALVGYAGGLRRSEPAAPHVRDLKLLTPDATASIRRSKGDQEGRGWKVVLPGEPIRPAARCGQ